MRLSKKTLVRGIASAMCVSALCMGAFALSGCSGGSDGPSAASSAATQSETRMFTDALGREVELPANLERICPSGHTAQQVLLTMAPDKMISLEQIANWNPELIIFQKGSVYNTVGDDPAWQGIAAIANDNFYEVPNDPWCWMNNPPTVNQLMGMQWLPRLLYPDAFDDSIEDVTKAYYKTMYNYDLSDAELSELLMGALPKAA